MTGGMTWMAFDRCLNKGHKKQMRKEDAKEALWKRRPMGPASVRTSSPSFSAALRVASPDLSSTARCRLLHPCCVLLLLRAADAGDGVAVAWRRTRQLRFSAGVESTARCDSLTARSPSAALQAVARLRGGQEQGVSKEMTDAEETEAEKKKKRKKKQKVEEVE